MVENVSPVESLTEPAPQVSPVKNTNVFSVSRDLLKRTDPTLVHEQAISLGRKHLEAAASGDFGALATTYAELEKSRAQLQQQRAELLHVLRTLSAEVGAAGLKSNLEFGAVDALSTEVDQLSAFVDGTRSKTRSKLRNLVTENTAIKKDEALAMKMVVERNHKGFTEAMTVAATNFLTAARQTLVVFGLSPTVVSASALSRSLPPINEWQPPAVESALGLVQAWGLVQQQLRRGRSLAAMQRQFERENQSYYAEEDKKDSEMSRQGLLSGPRALAREPALGLEVSESEENAFLVSLCSASAFGSGRMNFRSSEGQQNDSNEYSDENILTVDSVVQARNLVTAYQGVMLSASLQNWFASGISPKASSKNTDSGGLPLTFELLDVQKWHSSDPKRGAFFFLKLASELVHTLERKCLAVTNLYLKKYLSKEGNSNQSNKQSTYQMDFSQTIHELAGQVADMVQLNSTFLTGQHKFPIAQRISLYRLLQAVVDPSAVDVFKFFSTYKLKPDLASLVKAREARDKFTTTLEKSSARSPPGDVSSTTAEITKRQDQLHQEMIRALQNIVVSLEEGSAMCLKSLLAEKYVQNLGRSCMQEYDEMNNSSDLSDGLISASETQTGSLKKTELRDKLFSEVAKLKVTQKIKVDWQVDLTTGLFKETGWNSKTESTLNELVEAEKVYIKEVLLFSNLTDECEFYDDFVISPSLISEWKSSSTDNGSKDPPSLQQLSTNLSNDRYSYRFRPAGGPQQCSSLPGDYFFVLERSIQRIVHTSAVLPCCASLNHILDSLCFDFVSILEQNFKMSLQTFRIHVDASLTSQTKMLRPFSLATFVSLLSPAVQTSAKICSRECLPHALNNIHVASAFVKRFKSSVVGLLSQCLPDHVPKSSPKSHQREVAESDGLLSERKILESCLERFDEIGSKFDDIHNRAVESLATLFHSFFDDIFMQLQNSGWNISQMQIESAGSTDCVDRLKSILKTMSEILNQTSMQLFLVTLAKYIAACLEKLVLRIAESQQVPDQQRSLVTNQLIDQSVLSSNGIESTRITALGALTLDRELRLITSFFIDNVESTVRHVFARLFEMLDFLNASSAVELTGLLDTSTRKTWSMTLEETLLLIHCRCDFDGVEDAETALFEASKRNVLQKNFVTDHVSTFY